MTTRLDNRTPNNDRGLYMGKTRRVTLDTKFGETASWLKNVGAGSGDIVWRNQSGDLNIWNLESGEIIPCNAIEVLTSGTVDGTPETTGAVNLMWGSTPLDLEE
jgi:hypothetical protein